MGRKKKPENNAYRANALKKLVETYRRKGCNISATCEALGISRETFYEWCDKFPHIKQGIEAAQESLVDYADTKLMEKVQEGNMQALQFFLKAKGKKRGFDESRKIEVGGIGGEPIVRTVFVSEKKKQEINDHIASVVGEEYVNRNI